MSQHVTADASRLLSISGSFGEAEIADNRSHILVNLQTRNQDSGGILRRHHARANLPLEIAAQLRDLLKQAIAAPGDHPSTGRINEGRRR